MGENNKKIFVAVVVLLLIALLLTGSVWLAYNNDKSVKDDSNEQTKYMAETEDKKTDNDNYLTPCITDKSGSGGSEEELVKPASGTTAEPEETDTKHQDVRKSNFEEKDTITLPPSVTQKNESDKSGDKPDKTVHSEKDVITPEVKPTTCEEDNKETAENAEKTNIPTPTVNTPVPSPFTDTPVPTVKSVSPTPTEKKETPTPTIKVNTPVPTEKVSIPTQKVSTLTPTVKINTPVPTSTVHVCSSFEQISKTVTVPMKIVDVDKGPYDEEIITDQVYWCMSCGKSEHDLGFRTYNMETGETIWEDYKGFCEHCECCWIKTGKGGTWNDYKQQVINVIHHDHCYGKEVIPEHEDVVYGRKCIVCGEEYW